MSEAPNPAAKAAGPGADAAVQVIRFYEKHQTIHPRSVQGWFSNWRWALVWITQLIFYGLPWLTWNDRPAVLFDLVSRRFYIFNLVLYPQDFIYLTALLIISAYALFLFTAVAGRLWCGYACPQTVYSEIFMWVERRIEGDRQKRLKLDASPMNWRKLRLKTSKHAVWLLFSLWTGLTFVGYFTPIRVLVAEYWALFGAGKSALGGWEVFWTCFYGLATYGNAGFLREQVCKYMCPYARFQSAMFDRDTLIIGYDTARGEPRGSRPRSMPHAELATAGKGECIDCGLCVQVCPTGIDIRKGLQYECIGCAACIDVCDEVMDKMSYPRGLIRYDTQNGLPQGQGKRAWLRRVLRPRVLIYSAILLAILVAFFVSLALRSPFKLDVIRDRGSLARQVEDGRIENVYRLQIMNATEATHLYRISVSGLPGLQTVETTDVIVAPTELSSVVRSVQMPFDQAQSLGPGAHPMLFKVEQVTDGGAVQVISEKSTFVVPR